MASFYRYQGQEQEIFPLAALNIDDSGLAGFLDQIGLYHFPLRDYASGLSAFLATDPIPTEDSPYRAFAANPVNFTDPSGAVVYPSERLARGVVFLGAFAVLIDASAFGLYQAGRLDDMMFSAALVGSFVGAAVIASIIPVVPSADGSGYELFSNGETAFDRYRDALYDSWSFVSPDRLDRQRFSTVIQHGEFARQIEYGQNVVAELIARNNGLRQLIRDADGVLDQAVQEASQAPLYKDLSRILPSRDFEIRGGMRSLLDAIEDSAADQRQRARQIEIRTRSVLTEIDQRLQRGEELLGRLRQAIADYEDEERGPLEPHGSAYHAVNIEDPDEQSQSSEHSNMEIAPLVHHENSEHEESDEEKYPEDR